MTEKLQIPFFNPNPVNYAASPFVRYPDVPGAHIVFGDREDGYRTTILPNIEYQSDGVTLHLHILKPYFLQEGRKYPLLLYVQGSAWLKQETMRPLPNLAQFAQNGYVVASVEVRPAGEYTFPAPVRDVKSALRFLCIHAEEFQLDTSRVAFWGDSSGATDLLLCALSDPEQFVTAEYPCAMPTIKCVVDFYGCTDLVDFDPAPLSFARGNVVEMLLGGSVEEHMAAALDASAISYVSEDRPSPPILIMHGDEDNVVSISHSVKLYNRMKACGKTVEFWIVRGGGHGRRFFSEETFGIVRDFLRAYV